MKRIPLPPSRAIVVRGVAVEYLRAGSGRLRIVLLNGAGVGLPAWERIFPGLIELGTVLAYSRPGTGGSGRPTRPQDGLEAVATLHELFKGVEMSPPYLLVGHSLGGLYANLFARIHPDEVAGVVFLDASHPRDADSLGAAATPITRVLEKSFRVFSKLPPGRDFVETEFVAATARQIEAAGPFPDVPTGVLTGAKRPPSWLLPRDAFEIRMANQELLAALAPRTRHVIAEKSGHFPHFTEPELVLELIRWVAAQDYGDPSEKTAGAGTG